MSRATELVFLPGFDGAGELRQLFFDAMRPYSVRPVSYPNRTLETVDGYGQFAAGHIDAEARIVLIAESFSGLIAARWASRDPRIAGLVLCGSFLRNPAGWLTGLGAAMPWTIRLGSLLFAPKSLRTGAPSLDSLWSAGLWNALRALEPRVIAERLRLVAQADLTQDLSALSIPVLLVQFERDLVIRAGERAQLEAACPRAEIVRIDGPHFALETLPQECAEAISLRLGSLL